MNSNTIVAFYGSGTGNQAAATRNTIATQVLASTVETEFKVYTDTSGTTNIAVLQIPQQTDIRGSGNPQSPSGNAAILGSPFSAINPNHGPSRPYYASQQFDYARPFLVRLTGVATPVSQAANTLTLTIYSGTSKSGTAIATTGANTGTESSTAASAFIIETYLFWDSVGQGLCGQQWYAVNSGTPLYNTWKTNTAVATVTSVASLKFVASATWGNAAGGSITVGEFSISQM